MYHISATYKKTWVKILKLAVTAGASYYIYHRLIAHPSVDFMNLNRLIRSGNIVYFTGVMLLLSALNWVLESKKWQILVEDILLLSLPQAVEQSLAAHVFSLLTPLKAGEFGGKLLYYPQQVRRKIASRIVLGNFWQLTATLMFGLTGLGYMSFAGRKMLPELFPAGKTAIITATFLFAIVAGFFLVKYFGGMSKLFFFLSPRHSSINKRVVLLAVMRYLVFSHQLFFVMRYLRMDIDYIEGMMLIFSFYALTTLVPVMSLFDIVIKSSVALLVFAPVTSDELKILGAITLMWIFNFVLPAFPGGAFLILKRPDSASG